ncbi:MAG: diguanylate cyclase domain-containing protein [Bacillota bacterium]
MYYFSSRVVSNIIINAIGTFVLGIVFFYLYSKDKLKFLKYWSTYWFLTSLSLLSFVIFTYNINLFVLIYFTTFLLSILYLLKGAYNFFNLEFKNYYLYSFILFLIIGLILYYANYRNTLFLTSLYLNSFAYLLVSYIFYKFSKKRMHNLVAVFSFLSSLTLILYLQSNKLSVISLVNYYLVVIFLVFFSLSLIGVYYEKLQYRLKLREKHHKELFEKTPAGMLIIDKDGIVVRANEAHSNISGYEIEELEGSSIFDTVVPEEYVDSAKENIKEILNGKEKEYIGESISKSGEKIYIFFKETKIKLPDGRDCVLSMQIDYTDYSRQQNEIKYISFHDELTDLYNRSYMEEEMKRLDTKRQLPISIIMIDVNGLKIINDSYGHLAGDKLLKKTAKILKKSVREEDIVARWAGDEFIILLPQTIKSEAKKIEKRINKECNKTENDDIPVSLGIGIAVKKVMDENIYDTLNKADKYMYKNKLTESKSAKNKLLKNLLSTLGAKSDETEEHAVRMTHLAFQLGERIGLNDEELNNLSLLATLHDIGKVSISEEILTKKTKLTDEEWEKIKEHPKMGYRIASATEEFAPVAKYILHHHERWDGNGYPSGLEGKDIPLLSRIITIVDAYDVMSNGRDYKDAMSQEEIINEFRECSGTQFDPELVEEFIKILQEGENNK